MPFPFFQSARPLTRERVLRDAFAGLVQASMNIPQVLGYTRIAGTPVVTGLYTVLLPLIAFAAFGSSRHLVVAADSATAAIFSSALAGMAAPASPKYVALVGMVALLTAAMLLLARVFRLGFLADFISRTVLVGFLTGVGLQVGIAMLPDMLGIEVRSRGTLAQLWQLATGITRLHPSTLGLSIIAAAGILIGHRYARRVPVSLIVVVAAIAASYWIGFAAHGIAVIGPVPGGLPSLAWPDVDWGDTLAMLPIAASCVVMIVAQSAATSRAYALRHGERLDENADLLGLSAANAAAGLSGTFVVNGSPTQTAMAESVGARSQIAQLTFAAVVVLVLLFLTAPLQYLPRCVLAGIVFTIAVGMIDVAGLRDIRRESPREFLLAIVTAAAVVAIGVEQGILLAIALSLLRHVEQSYRPNTAVLKPDANEHWEPTSADAGNQTEPGLIVYRFSADLFYANEGHFADQVRALVAQAPAPVRWLVIDASAITDLDYSAARSLRDLHRELCERGVTMLFARVTPFLRAEFDRHLITPQIGAEDLFETLHEAIAALRERDRRRQA